MWVFLWILLALLVGAVGSDKSLGFMGSFLLSLLLSPVVGLIIVLLLNKNEDPNVKQPIIMTTTVMDETKKSDPTQASVKSVAEELDKLFALKEKSAITEEEYNQLKSQLIQGSVEK